MSDQLQREMGWNSDNGFDCRLFIGLTPEQDKKLEDAIPEYGLLRDNESQDRLLADCLEDDQTFDPATTVIKKRNIAWFTRPHPKYVILCTTVRWNGTAEDIKRGFILTALLYKIIDFLEMDDALGDAFEGLEFYLDGTLD